jgi:hypothetical protein
MAIATDILIIGAGAQGLTLLDALGHDYSVILIGSAPAVSESRHWHAYFSSGWNAADPTAAGIYRACATAWASRLSDHGIEPHESSFCAAIPPQFVERLEPNWQALGLAYEPAACPPPFEANALPPHRVIRFPEDLSFDAGAALQALRRPHTECILEGTVRGFRLEGGRIAEVEAEVGSQVLTIAPEQVLIAAGAGNAVLLRQLGATDETVRASQLVRPMHMLSARGPDLPVLAAFFMDLVVIGHPGPDGETIWLITYNPPEPRVTAGVVDMAADPAVEPAVLQASIARLTALLPDFRERARDCRWDVYVGWKTDAPGPDPGPLLELSYPRPYHITDAGLDNARLVWPNHWGLAHAATEEVMAELRRRCRSRHPQPQLPASHAAEVAMKWCRADRKWRSWNAFAACYDLPA